MGLVMAPFFDIALADVEERETGSASGVLNAVQQLGGSIGVAVLGTAFFSYAADGGTVPATQWTALMAAAAFVAALAAAFLLPRHAREGTAGH
ncbi:hypothetical protein ACIF70_11625 [Actinacidiphila glaucinigra]|uniref:hypothetical protein n=1 Tax=Actinacidiphila glaucinigra TaxID=235986 RepID=UPI0037CBBBC7